MENKKPFENNIEFFSALLQRFPNKNFEALHFKSGESQVARFIVLAQIANLEQASVLDYGCGLGDFGYFLEKMNQNKNYIGVDISADMVQAAKSKFPALRFKNITHDKMLDEIERPDYCIASGVFNLRQEDEELTLDYLLMNLRVLFEHSTVGDAFNFTTNNSGDNTFAIFDPVLILNEAKKLSPKVVLREDYMMGDATIYIYK